jgi:hypothetical protein
MYKTHLHLRWIASWLITNSFWSTAPSVISMMVLHETFSTVLTSFSMQIPTNTRLSLSFQFFLLHSNHRFLCTNKLQTCAMALCSFETLTVADPHDNILLILMFCWPCIIVYQYNGTNVMHFLFNLLRIKGLYMFRALLAHPQEVLHKPHSVYYLRIMSVGCVTVAVKMQSWHSQLTLSSACRGWASNARNM